MNIIDRAVTYFSPIRGEKRARARLLMNAYDGASTIRRSMSSWSTLSNSPNDDVMDSIDKLRERSRDLEQNNPLASGILKTKLNNVIGSGMRFHPQLDSKLLSLSDDQTDEWEYSAEQEWKLFFDTKDIDISRISDGNEITRIIYDQKNLNGDCVVLLVNKPIKFRPYNTRLQLIEADRLSNPQHISDSKTMCGGVEMDEFGAPIAYHIADEYGFKQSKWDKIIAYNSSTGLPNVLHIFDRKRPGQSRGVPDLHCVIESLKMLGRYSEAELMAAVISGMFTVFIETATGDGAFDFTMMQDETGRKSSDKDYKLAPGQIVSLAKGEKIHDSNPGRPNTAFDAFYLAIVRQIAVGVQLPYEVVLKTFNSSYSASRAAMLDAWRYFYTERTLIVNSFLRPLYRRFMYEAVSSGRIKAPGFFSDPLIQNAYLGCEFVGPAKGHIDEGKEIKASILRMNSNISTLQKETAELTGGDWEANCRQRVKEVRRMKEGGLQTNINETGESGIEENNNEE